MGGSRPVRGARGAIYRTTAIGLGSCGFTGIGTGGAIA